LTFFAHYSTDTAGHEKNMAAAVAALERVDSFLGGLIPALPPETLLVIASDHGNIEDISKGHTRNPTFSLLRGPGAGEAAKGVSRITDIPGLILRHLTGTD
jgi:phosphopentomutase